MPMYRPYNSVDTSGRRSRSKSTRKATYLYNKYEAKQETKAHVRAKKDRQAADKAAKVTPEVPVQTNEVK